MSTDGSDLAIPEDDVDDRIRKIVWRGLGTKSVRQMSEETGLTPEQIFAVKRDLLSAVDVLTVQQKRQKILIMLEDMAHEALERAGRSTDEFSAGHYNAARGAMKDALTELNRLGKGEQEAVTKLNQMRINELLRLIDVTVARTLEEISKTYGLDQSELLGIFQGHLKPVAQELEEQ